jgi:hypothetical protein
MELRSQFRRKKNASATRRPGLSIPPDVPHALALICAIRAHAKPVPHDGPSKDEF